MKCPSGSVRKHLGTFIAIPESAAQNAALRLREMGENALADIIDGSVPYEPDNHHNAAFCPYCSPAPNNQVCRVIDCGRPTRTPPFCAQHSSVAIHVEHTDDSMSITISRARAFIERRSIEIEQAKPRRYRRATREQDR